MFFTNWIESIIKRNKYYFNIEFKIKDKDKSELLYSKFLEFVKKLELKPNGVFYDKKVILSLFSNKNIKQSTIRRIKEWLFIYGILDFTISDIIKYKE